MYALLQTPFMEQKKEAVQAFYKRLVDAFDGAGLPSTQTYIAFVLNLYQSAVSKWKTGEGYPSIPNVVQLAHITGVSVGWLLTGEGDRGPDRMDELTKAMLLAWDKLPEASKEEMLRFMQFRSEKAIVPTTSPPRSAPEKQA